MTTMASKKRSALELLSSRNKDRYPLGHKLTAKDSKRVKCDGGPFTGKLYKACNKQAKYCEYSIGGPPFFYYCAEHWNTPGPHGSTPNQRAHLKKDDLGRRL